MNLKLFFFRALMNAEHENKDISRLSQHQHAPTHKLSLFLMKWGKKEIGIISLNFSNSIYMTITLDSLLRAYTVF